MHRVPLKIKRVRNSGLSIPEYKSEGAAGFDLFADLTEKEQPIITHPGYNYNIPTGFAFEIPVGYQLEIRPRSGLAVKYGFTIINSPGTIDSDYRGEVIIIGYRTIFPYSNLADPFVIRHGDRIAQAVLMPVYRAIFEEVEELPETERGIGGFGSTGV